MQLLERKIPPPVLAALIAPLMWLAADHPVSGDTGHWLRFVLVTLLAAAGALVDFLAVLAFLRRKTAVNPFEPQKASTLVTSGVFRLSRNPMYAGLLLLLTAWGLYLWSLWPVLGPVFFFVYVSRFQIIPEERILKKLFGAPYHQYLQDVRRWL